MKTASRTLTALVFVLGCGSNALAQIVTQEVSLLPSGRTIGRPGAVRTVGGELTLLQTNDNGPLPLCVTIVNIGEVQIRAEVEIFSPGPEITANLIHPGHTGTAGKSGAQGVTAVCVAKGSSLSTQVPYRFLWRMDLAQ